MAGNADTPVGQLNALMADDAGLLPRWHRYFEPLPALSKGLPAPILGIMVLIWQLREQDLQRRYRLNSRAGRIGFLSWCVAHGRSEYRALRQADLLWQALDQPAQFDMAALAPDDPAWAISWKMRLAVLERADLAFDIQTRAGRAALLAWWVMNGRNELGFGADCFTPWQNIWFFSPAGLPGLNRLQALIYQHRPDVAAQFPLPQALAGYIAWFRQFISSETRMIDALRSLPAVSATLLALAPARAGGRGSDAQRKPFGVNVIGYAFGQLGIGEDARMMVRSLDAANVPVTLLDFAPGKDVAQQDRSMAQWVGSEAVYAVNVFCLAALEHGRFFAEQGSAVMEGHINIAYWPWELPHWPAQWQHLLALADEVWVSSKHILDALQPVCRQPLRQMPMAVTVDEPACRTRADFALPGAACLFLFVFDLNSSAKRKNPRACLQAFLQAFPAHGDDALGADQVGLVIKVHPPKGPNPEWDELKRLQASDPRIHLIEQTLSRQDLLALYQVCDCFLSLHRAEGFGRCIAEAMLLGKLVISTGYSGNLAFTRADNALLVDYQLQPLAVGDYPYGDGQAWAEPDVAHAAALMRQVLQKSPAMLALAQQGQATIAAEHDPQVIGHRYARVLGQLLPGAQGKPRFFVLDQHGSSSGGHFLAYSLCVAHAAQQHGFEVLLLCQRSLAPGGQMLDGVPLQHCFYGNRDEGGVPRMPPFAPAHPVFETEAILRQTGAGALDHVLLHTVDLLDLPAWLNWLLQMPLPRMRQMPHLHIVLRFDPALTEQDRSSLWPELRWQLAQRQGALAPLLHCHADTAPLAARYAALLGWPVALAPIPFDPACLLAAAGPLPVVPSRALTAIYLGDARPEKGFAQLPALARALWASHLQSGRLRLVIQANLNVPGGQGNTRQAIADLAAFPPDCVELIHTPMAPAEYYARLMAADIVLLPYDPVSYQSRSSGILIEALAAGKPVVTTRASWMASQLDPAQAALVDEQQSLAQALLALLARWPQAQDAARQQAPRWLAQSAPGHFLQHLLAQAGATEAIAAPAVPATTSATTTAAATTAAAADPVRFGAAPVPDGMLQALTEVVPALDDPGLALTCALLAACYLPGMENPPPLPARETIKLPALRRMLRTNWQRALGGGPDPCPPLARALPPPLRQHLLASPAVAIETLLLLAGLRPVAVQATPLSVRTTLVLHGGLQNSLVLKLRCVSNPPASAPPRVSLRLNGKLLHAQACNGQADAQADALAMYFDLPADPDWPYLQVLPLQIRLAARSQWQIDTVLQKESLPIAMQRQCWRSRADWHAPEQDASQSLFAWSAAAAARLYCPVWRGAAKLLLAGVHASHGNAPQDLKLLLPDGECGFVATAPAATPVFAATLPACSGWPFAQPLRLQVRHFGQAGPNDRRQIGIALSGFSLIQTIV